MSNHHRPPKALGPIERRVLRSLMRVAALVVGRRLSRALSKRRS